MKAVGFIIDIKLTLLSSSPFGGVVKSYATATRAGDARRAGKERETLLFLRQSRLGGSLARSLLASSARHK